MSEEGQIKLRVDLALKDFIEKEAAANHRTINGEVTYRLEQSKSMKKEAIEDKAYEFSRLLASALIQDPSVEVNPNLVHGFRQPTINGVRQAFELFLATCPSNRGNLGVETRDDGLRFYNGSEEYIIKNSNPYPDGAYTINHLARILKILYFLPLMKS